MLVLLAVALYLHVSDALAVHVDFHGQTMRCRFAPIELGITWGLTPEGVFENGFH